MVVTAYGVPGRTGTALLEVNRSRFLAVVARVATEAEARTVVEAARKEHWDARHHCSAFVLGPDGRVALPPTTASRPAPRAPRCWRCSAAPR